MFLIVYDETVKNELVTAGCKLIQEKTDINKKTIWCFEKAPDFSFDIKSEKYKGKMFAVDRVRFDF